MSEERTFDLMLWVPTVAVALAIITAIVAAVVLVNADKQQEPERPEATSLDVVSYDAPLWASERITDCWYMQDRRSNRAWWLMKLDGQWLGLDAGEVKSE